MDTFFPSRAVERYDFLNPDAPREPNLSFSRDFKKAFEKMRSAARKTKRWATSSKVKGSANLELPNEMILAIIDQVEDTKTLRNLRLTAKACEEAAAKKLFATISKPFTYHGLADLLNIAKDRNGEFITKLIIHEPAFLSTALVSPAVVRALWHRAVRRQYLAIPAQIAVETLTDLRFVEFEFRKVGQGLLLHGGLIRAWNYLAKNPELVVKIGIKGKPTKRWKPIVSGIDQLPKGRDVCFGICETDPSHATARRCTLVSNDMVTGLWLNGRPGRAFHDLGLSIRTIQLVQLKNLNLCNITVPSWEISTLLAASAHTLERLRLAEISVEDDFFTEMIQAIEGCTRINDIALGELSVCQDRLHVCFYLEGLKERVFSSATRVDHLMLASVLSNLLQLRRSQEEDLMVNGAVRELMARSQTRDWCG